MSRRPMLDRIAALEAEVAELQERLAAAEGLLRRVTAAWRKQEAINRVLSFCLDIFIDYHGGL